MAKTLSPVISLFWKKKAFVELRHSYFLFLELGCDKIEVRAPQGCRMGMSLSIRCLTLIWTANLAFPWWPWSHPVHSPRTFADSLRFPFLLSAPPHVPQSGTNFPAKFIPIQHLKYICSTSKHSWLHSHHSNQILASSKLPTKLKTYSFSAVNWTNKFQLLKHR